MLGCVLCLPVLLLAAMAAAAVLPWTSSSDCTDPREDCGASDSGSGDHTLPEVLHRFSLSAPCGTTNLRYAYSDVWNDTTEIFALHATVTPDCLRAFVAQVAPGTDLDAAPLVRPDDDGHTFPFRLKFGRFPNGPLVLPTSGHTYRIVTRTTNDRQVDLTIDADAPSPTIEARFEWTARDVWPTRSH